MLEEREALRQQAARDAGRTALDVGERLASHQNVADDDRRPTLGEDLGAASNGAVLAVGAHSASVTSALRNA
jgi:hypothetical protein